MVAMLELEGTNLTYEEFRRSCLVPNRPAIIRNACRSAGSSYFHLAELIHRLSPQALHDTIGPRTLVPVYPTPFTATLKDTEAKCDSLEAPHDAEGSTRCVQTCWGGGALMTPVEVEGSEEDDGGCREVPLAVVLQSWALGNAGKGAGDSESRVYYLKDWHLQEALERAATTAECERTGQQSAAAPECVKQRESGVHGSALYRVPHFLGADWMDPFCRYVQSASSPRAGHPRRSSTEASETSMEGAAHGLSSLSSSAPTCVGFGNNRSDYRFAYIGSVGSWTPLHCDVFGTYSWSFNVCGDKLWFFPTMAGNAYLHEHLLPLFPTPPDIRVLTGFEMEGVVQHPGDLVFVPARFYHQVHNVSGMTFPFPSYAGTETDAKAAASTASGEGAGKGRQGGAMPTSTMVGPLTMALNHNWCNVFNIECMVRTFLSDAQRLVGQLSVDDLGVICDTKDVAVWREYVDTMLHNGTNWSHASMKCFLEFCVRHIESLEPGMIAVEDERGAAELLARQLLSEVCESYEHLFET
ncbi:hypothetical protein ABL78_3216 [Leptomonas seymouri]|uniref:JmjC domain-containing protein n=1 Tax=Leptomonas seymouri TaxID=5684 RepID=A0A0N1I519_LEPSE|nr:hypothetical protein ABL78_3216 [Leptomonas seymouri]|eukprot:KPI87678.1 hypothetical protein ABL78_3216 [Leptomonas seymouri]